MSADLFAEFGEAPKQSSSNNAAQPQQHQPAGFSFFDDLASLTPAPVSTWSQTQHQAVPQSANAEEDDWGEFEAAGSTNPQKQDSFNLERPREPSSRIGWESAPVVKARKSYDSSVLFDAEEQLEEEEDNDFGDFEGTTTNAASPPPATAPAQTQSGQLIDLLGDLSMSQPEPRHRAQKDSKKPQSLPSQKPAKAKPVHGFGPVSRPKPPAPASTNVESQQEETWDTFDDWEASIPSTKHKTSEPSTRRPQAPQPTTKLQGADIADDVRPGELPPTNVPPPSLLLSLFPPLFSEAHEKLFKPMAAQPPPARNRLVSEPATIAYLQGLIVLASVAARIIAGRKLRWKRDKHLSQGMRIGPASSRSTSGMKLTGIDKGENLKEEREVSDVIRAWKQQVGRVRHAVAAANQARAASLGAVPDLQDTMAVQTLKQAEGGVPALQACMLCGLKRDERVVAADMDAEDIFGEWWVDQVAGTSGTSTRTSLDSAEGRSIYPTSRPVMRTSCDTSTLELQVVQVSAHQYWRPMNISGGGGSRDEAVSGCCEDLAHGGGRATGTGHGHVMFDDDPDVLGNVVVVELGGRMCQRRAPQGMSRPQADGSPHALRTANNDGPLPKNKSTGNLLALGQGAPPALNLPKRSSIDAGQLDRLTRSPIIPEHEHGLGASGLRRIRQQPPLRLHQAAGTGSLAMRSASLNSAPPGLRHPTDSTSFAPSAPASPTFGVEDLHRFPSESLHSFSFATQTEESIYNRQNVLKRSIDFMRDRLGWGATNTAIASAQAKISGDHEVQSMLELLTRAHLIGEEASGAHGLGTIGPATGPADVSGPNIFEKTLIPRSESPEPLDPSKPEPSSSESGTQDSKESRSTSVSEVTPESTIAPPQPPAPRAALKRTLTDVAPLTIQSQLNDALAQPYVIGDASRDPTASSLAGSTASVPFSPGPVPLATGPAPHGPGNRWTPAAQAIFTTEAHAPWTITAANDLACLVFGVTRAEVRKIGIMEVVREERRKWLADKLSDPFIGSKASREAPSQSQQPAVVTTSLKVGNGVTAKLLSKPSSRQLAQERRAKTDDGSGSSYAKKPAKGGLNHESKGSRGVLLCGDVVPILKRNGATGAASLWVKEKRGGLIWVLEEIAEDVVYIHVDEVGCVSKAEGAIEAVFGSERLRRGMDLKRLIPAIPRLEGTNTGALDYDQIDQFRHFTARTSNNINIPVAVEAMPDEPTFRVSSFPHIAGIVVLSASDLTIASSNSVFSTALFGQPRPEGMHIRELLPAFDQLLKIMTDEDKVDLHDGIVIPEQSFRRARALLAMRDGKGDAAALFLRPSGVPAVHRDGFEIMVDVQMRVVRNAPSGTRDTDTAILEEPLADLVYALWITYSRHLHASNHGQGPVTPLLSRPATPPHQPSPGQSILPSPEDAGKIVDPSSNPAHVSMLTKQIQKAVELAQPPSPAEPLAKQLAPPTPTEEPRKKKTIDDFVVLEDMGQGAYGQVKLCRYKKNGGKKVVVKYVTKRRILVDTWTRDRKLGTVPLEIHVLDYLRRDGLKHPNIVEMYDFFEDEINYYIEMIPHGLPGMDLFDYIELRVNMDEKECRKIFVQVTEAIYHLHVRAKVVHRDIKDENVILDGEGNIKLIDFGSAAYIKNGPFDVFVGTIDYAAPEVLAGRQYRGKEQDVWALGILLYTIVYKENPFYSIDEIMDHDLRVPYIMSEESIDLIRLMLDRDVDKRITISQVLDHPWCKMVDSPS
ncbi:Pkinase-domain-containing protein [Sporormia fimetaria CBS 119925]|uniref:non-specific serine/threonine protein kinase n=1 Tax=Sporormia fimetaria CBS 119925 TaxID=1340428 RepID=A0A6A6V6H2_9PLEO|nr:Pkinase-domain-containing protein [Sporormia fimetaria CBS 119925]